MSLIININWEFFASNAYSLPDKAATQTGTLGDKVLNETTPTNGVVVVVAL